jgi:ribosomal protein L7Ae-like RNA K-turn-binding protein
LTTVDPAVRFVGLALRAHKVAVGREACKRAERRGELHLLVVAADAGRSAARDAGAGERTPVVRIPLDRAALGKLVGRDTLAVLGITDPSLAAGLANAATAMRPDAAARDEGS